MKPLTKWQADAAIETAYPGLEDEIRAGEITPGNVAERMTEAHALMLGMWPGEDPIQFTAQQLVNYARELIEYHATNDAKMADIQRLGL